MMTDFKDTLTLPFRNGLLEYPGDHVRWVFLNAEPLNAAEFDWKQSLICEQRSYTEHAALTDAGFSAVPEWHSECISGALVNMHRSRRVNELNFQRAWNAAGVGSPIVCVGAKKQGILSLRNWVARQTPPAGSLSKHHAVVFWTLRTDRLYEVEPVNVVKDGYLKLPGVFSADGVDTGSALLAEHFDGRIAGRVADLGAGWGFLSAEIVKRSNHVEALELFDVDWLSLQSAKENMKSSKIPSEYHWCDIASIDTTRRFDWIVMNPPFHKTRAAEPELGRQFIRQAAALLKPRGRLLMVANRQLPYERELAAHFVKVDKVSEKGGFKVFEAIAR